MLADGPSRSKRPRITDDDDWPQNVLDDVSCARRELPCYKCCLASSRSISGPKDVCGGYLEAGIIDRLLSGVGKAFPRLEAAKRILGVQIVSSTGLARQLVPLFHLARRMSDLLVAADPIRNEWMKANAPAGNISTLRRQADDFLLFVVSCVESLVSEPCSESSNPPVSVVNGAYHQLLCMQKHVQHHLGSTLRQSRTSLSLPLADHNAGIELLFHLLLDIGLAILGTLVMLCKHRVDRFLSQPPQQLLMRHCRSQALDLLQLQLSALEVALPDLQHVELMACACTREVWLTLRHALDWCSEQYKDSMSFWSLINSTLSDFLSPPSSSSSEGTATCQWLSDCAGRIDEGHRRSCCWLLLGFFNQLYFYDRQGRFVQKPSRVFANWLFVQDLLRTSVDKEATSVSSADRTHAHHILSNLLPLAVVWPASQDTLLLLWDVMHKFLNVGSTQHRDHSWSSVCQWVKQCSEVCTLPQDSESLPKDELLWWKFLRILAVELNKPQPDVSSNMWLRVKGRFLSRFNRRRMQELNRHGLENFCSLFLVLALSTETTDIVSKMLPLLETIPLDDVSCQIVCWRGILAAHALCERQNVATNLAQKVLASRCAGLLRSTMTSGCSDQISVLSYVLDSVEDLHNSGYLLGSLHLIVSSEWSAVFADPMRRERECCRLLEAVVWLVEVVRSGMNMGSEDSSEANSENTSVLCTALWQVVYPLLRQLSSQHVGLRLGQQVADVSMAFVQLSILLPTAGADGHTFQSIVQHFGCSLTVGTGIRLRFLSHVMSDNDTGHLLLSDDKSPIAMLVHAWLSAAVSCGGSNNFDPHIRDPLMEFSRSMEKLPEIQRILERRDPGGLPDAIDVTNRPMWEASILSVIRQLGVAFRHANGEEKIQLRQQANDYFSCLLQLANSHVSMELETVSAEVKCLYRIAGCVIQWCSTLLYSRMAHRCLLPQLLDKLVLPLSTKKKPVPTALDSCIRRHVYQFVFGVATLDFSRDDFVRRKLREIFQRYLLVPSKTLSAFGGISASHPYLIALSSLKAVIGPSELKALRQLLLTTLRDAFLGLPTKLPNMLLGTVKLMSTMHQLSKPETVFSDCHLVLRRLLSCLLACELGRAGVDSRNIKAPLELLVKNIFLKADAASGENRRAVLQLVTEYSSEHLTEQKHTVFKPLIAIASSCPGLMAEYCVFAEGLVQQYEITQGKGNDLLMRNALQQLQRAVQRGVSATGPLAR